MKKILIVSEAHLIRTFLQSTIEKIKEETGSQFDCFIVNKASPEIQRSLKEVFEHVYVNEYPKDLLNRIPKIRTFQTIFGLKKVARTL
jgi:hypothetical protein